MCFGPFTRLLHWGPLSVLAIIKCITGMTLYCVSMLWPPTSRLAIANTVFHLSLSGLTLYNFLCSVYHGPGYVELGWRPAKEEDISKLQFCEICNGYKAPRAHHCRKCGRCVLKMDHHCPWINNCVGWGNHCHFIAFLMFAVVGCFQASLILSTAFYKHLFVTWYIERGLRVTYFGVYGFIMCVFTFGMAFGVVIAVGMLLVCQVKAVIKNRTSIEDWIVEKAKFRRRKHDTPFVFPYDIGYFGNVRQVVTYNCEPWGDGIHYPVRRGCDQYTLTLEQIAQKLEKRERTKIYSITRNYSGSWIPITQGLKVCCSPPCTDEPRIKLQEGDTVVVTRWRKHWLYGVKMEDGLSAEYRVKGWFPRRCAVEINDELSDLDNGNGNDNRPRKKKLKKV